MPKWHHRNLWHRFLKSIANALQPACPAVFVTRWNRRRFSDATVNQFVVQAAYSEAQRVVERESIIRLSQRDARKVLALLDNPPKPAKRLKDAVKTFKAMVDVYNRIACAVPRPGSIRLRHGTAQCLPEADRAATRATGNLQNFWDWLMRLRSRQNPS